MDQLDKARERVKAIEGQKVAYAIKSDHLDLYDFGFGEEKKAFFDKIRNEVRALPPYALHATCHFVVHGPDGTQRYFDETVTKAEFADIEKEIIGKVVLRADITPKHRLVLYIDDMVYVFIPFDDDMESWRFFSDDENERHLVVSRYTIEL